MKIVTWITTVLLSLPVAASSQSNSGGLPSTRTVRAALEPAKQRRPAPGFTLPDASGRLVHLADYHGRVLLLDFWATTCGGCVEEIPAFIDLATRYEHNGLATVGIAEDIAYANLKDDVEAWARVNPFVQEHKVPYHILMGDGVVTGAFDIRALPLTYLIDRLGRVAAVYSGVVDVKDLEANIQALLKESKR